MSSLGLALKDLFLVGSAHFKKLPETEWVRARYDALVLLDEKRLKALSHVQIYQKRIERHFNRRVKIRNIKEGHLVLKALRKTVLDPRGSSVLIGQDLTL